MNLPKDLPPPTATQNLHDETLNVIPCATTTNNSINTIKIISLFKNVTAPSTTKNENQEPISNLVTFKTREMIGSSSMPILKS